MILKDGRITFLINREETTIEIRDNIAGITFVRVKLTPKQLSSALSRIMYTECESVEVENLEKVGKVRESKKIEFEIPKNTYSSDKELLKKLTDEACPDGWIPDYYFNSQDSFYMKKGKRYARVIIRRWV
jgi:hypothetical protein